MRILITLLFISFNSFSQTYEDIMSINSLNSFTKVCIENGYELVEKYEYPYDSSFNYTKYGFDLTIDEESKTYSAYIYAIYVPHTEAFEFQFFLENDEANKRYNSIVEGIKKGCKYYGIIDKASGGQAVTYSCPQSLYKGKIGFMIKDGSGFLTHFYE